MALKIDNRRTTDEAAKALRRAIENIANVHAPVAMEEIGEETIEYSKATHTFQNQTGNLESGYTYAVFPPGTSGQIEWKSLDGGGSEIMNSKSNEVLLVFGNGVDYAIFVDTVHGFDVSTQTFLMVRRELGKILKDKLRMRKLF